MSKNQFLPFFPHREGINIIITLFIISFLLIWLGHKILSCVLAIFGVFCCYFFRNPDKVSPVGKNYILSPADGTIQDISLSDAPKHFAEYFPEKMLKVSIFLSVFNVHVNRVPVDGKIEKIVYSPGKFFNASLDKASYDNEKNAVLITSSCGHKIVFCQIAGFVARRIVCDLEKDQNVLAGQRFGIIKFGSRVDIYLPKELKVLVGKGQIVSGGETVISKFNFSDENEKIVFSSRE